MQNKGYPYITEPDNAGNLFREEYLAGLHKLIDRERMKADKERVREVEKLLKDPEAGRQDFRHMMGWPLTEERDKSIKPEVIKTPVIEKEGVMISRLQIEIFPDLYYYGILFQSGPERKPLIISQHGGGGTPELCSGMLERGTVNYNDMTGRILQYDVHVFAPQMLLWDPAQFQTQPVSDNMEDQRRNVDFKLKQLGGSIAAMELYCLQKSLDYLEKESFVEADKIGMIGLSYGGFYTLYMAALDTRIKSALCSCFFRKKYTLEWPDFIWQSGARTFMDAETAMLVYPRKLNIQMGDHDEIFECKQSKEEMDRLKKYAAKTDADWLTLDIFDGEHEFWNSDAPIERVVQDLNI